MLILMGTGAVDSLVAQGIFYDVGDSDPPTVLAQPIGDRRVELVFPGSAPAQPLSAVVFVIGVPDHRSSLGPLMDLEHYQDWARIVAAEGYVGVLYSTSDPVTDLRELMVFIASEGPRLGIDPDRVALMAASANAATALHYVRSDNPLQPRALVVYYGLMPTPDGFQAKLLQQGSTGSGFALPGYEPEHAYPPDLPIFAVRAGRDAATVLLASIDHFAAYALAANLHFRLLNYPGGQHSFDSRDDTMETRNVIEETLRFLATHLN